MKKKSLFEKENINFKRKCFKKDCLKPGIYKAPKSKNEINNYIWLIIHFLLLHFIFSIFGKLYYASSFSPEYSSYTSFPISKNSLLTILNSLLVI